MSVKTIIIIAVIHIISGNISKAVVKSKNYPDSINHGFAWGFFLGILGLIICLFKTPIPKRRPSTSSCSSNYSRNTTRSRNTSGNGHYRQTNSRTVTR